MLYPKKLSLFLREIVNKTQALIFTQNCCVIWQTGIFGTLDTIFGRDERDVTSINLTYDEDVILHLINKLIGVSPKIDKS